MRISISFPKLGCNCSWDCTRKRCHIISIQPSSSAGLWKIYGKSGSAVLWRCLMTESGCPPLPLICLMILIRLPNLKEKYKSGSFREIKPTSTCSTLMTKELTVVKKFPRLYNNHRCWAILSGTLRQWYALERSRIAGNSLDAEVYVVTGVLSDWGFYSF